MEFNLDTLTTLLVAIAPTVSAVASIIIGFITFVRKIKKETNVREEEIAAENKQLKKDIAVMKSKLTSIEKNLLNDNRR